MVAHLAPQGPRLRPGQGEAVAPPRAPAARSGEERGLLSLGKARPVVQNLHLKAFLLQEAETHLAVGRLEGVLQQVAEDARQALPYGGVAGGEPPFKAEA